MRITDKLNTQTEQIAELHKMRYFFLPELRAMLKQAGFFIVRTQAGLTNGALDDSSWYGLIMAQKEG